MSEPEIDHGGRQRPTRRPLFSRYSAHKTHSAPKKVLIAQRRNFPHNLQESWASMVPFVHELQGALLGLL